uniref:C2H2-type domain-containing protein n=1 Tax=Graphocephala atropunctata TaxID=36148 RepID=A0A1B6KYI8_9HEMI
MSSIITEDRSTRMFNVFSIDPGEEFILGDPLEDTTSDSTPKYKPELQENEEVKCRKALEDNDDKKNVILDLVKPVQSEHNENLLDQKHLLALKIKFQHRKNIALKNVKKKYIEMPNNITISSRDEGNSLLRSDGIKGLNKNALVDSTQDVSENMFSYKLTQNIYSSSGTTGVKRNNNGKSKNAYSPKTLLSPSSSPITGIITKPSLSNSSYQQKVQPIEVTKVSNEDLVEVPPVKENEQVKSSSKMVSDNRLKIPISTLKKCTISRNNMQNQRETMSNTHSSVKGMKSTKRGANKTVKGDDVIDRAVGNALIDHDSSNKNNGDTIERKNLSKLLSKIADSNCNDIRVSEYNTVSSFVLPESSLFQEKLGDKPIIGKLPVKSVDKMLGISSRLGSNENNDSTISSGSEKILNSPPVQKQDERFKNTCLSQLPQLTNKKFMCKICDKVLKNSRTLKFHLERHSGIKNYVCLLCCKAYTSQYSLDYHNKTIHSTESHKCNQCSKVYGCKKALSSHVIRSHSEIPKLKARYRCDPCNKRYCDSKRLKEHNLVKHSIEYDRELNFICDHCSSKFLDKNSLKNHIFLLHMPPMFQCEKCLVKFVCKTRLVNHMRGVHLVGNKKTFVCEICGKVLKSNESLKRHLLTHTDKFPFVCEECGKRFRTITNLEQHLRIHSDRRPYTCDLCDKSFRIRHHLRQHMAVHGMVSIANHRKRARKMSSSSESNG